MTDSESHGALFEAAEAGAIAHLHRAEMYRSTIWRTRLDTTTNWAVVTTGIALSLAFSSPTASSLPLALVGLLVTLFLVLEARRYRYFDLWRLRTRVLENHFYAPLLLGEGSLARGAWAVALANDYRHPAFHISFLDAVGRRLRRNYGWIFLVQIASYIGKLIIHPDTMTTLTDLWERAAIGPVPGQIVLLVGLTFHGSWIAIAVGTWRSRRGPVISWNDPDRADPMLDLSTRG